jgi:ketosteroid isomerase-like protein
MRRTGALGVLAVFMAAGMSAQDGVPASLALTRHALEAGYYNADAAGIAQLFTEDADVVIDGMRATGREQIYALYKTQLTTRTLLVFSARKLQASGGLAVESGVSLTRLATLRFAIGTPARNGRYLIVFTNIDGDWRISSLMIQNAVTFAPENTSDRPALRVLPSGGT